MIDYWDIIRFVMFALLLSTAFSPMETGEFFTFSLMIIFLSLGLEAKFDEESLRSKIALRQLMPEEIQLIILKIGMYMGFLGAALLFLALLSSVLDWLLS